MLRKAIEVRFGESEVQLRQFLLTAAKGRGPDGPWTRHERQVRAERALPVVRQIPTWSLAASSVGPLTDRHMVGLNTVLCDRSASKATRLEAGTSHRVIRSSGRPTPRCAVLSPSDYLRAGG